MASVRAEQDDLLDLIMYRATGRTAGVTEAAFERNRGLAGHGPVLPQGTTVDLPEQPHAPAEAQQVQLWT